MEELASHAIPAPQNINNGFDLVAYLFSGAIV